MNHWRETIVVAAPIALALLSEIGMGLISTAMLGQAGDRALAAGGFGTNVFITILLVLQGLLSGVGVLAANRLGAGVAAEVPQLYWSGVALAALLAIPMFALLSQDATIWVAVGQPADLARDVAAYLHILRWGVPAGVVGIGMMRQFLPAIGRQLLLVWVMPAGLVLHAGLNLALVPRYGLAGSAWAIVITLSATAFTLLALLHAGSPRLVRWRRPQAAALRPLLAIGLPVSVTVAVEAGLFLATGILAGVLGPTALAAHTIALSVVSVSFMVPLAVSQAANVRVAAFQGARDMAASRQAGFAAILLSLAFMATSACVLSLMPHTIVALYLPPSPATAATAALAANLLRIAGFFQLADGTQVTAAGALRGLQDVRVPMLMASFGYWGIGFWAGWALAFPAHLGVVGLWWGLCAGLAVVAASLLWRFARRSALQDSFTRTPDLTGAGAS